MYIVYCCLHEIVGQIQRKLTYSIFIYLVFVGSYLLTDIKLFLFQVIVKRHPQFQTVVDRLLDVYLLLSAGRHGYTLSDNNNDDGDIGKFLSHDGRMISTRY